MIGTIKLILAILAGGLALIAAVKKTRDPAGGLTRWGRVLIGAISVTLALSVLQQPLEIREQATKDAEALRRFEVALSKQELTLKRLAQLVVRQEQAAANAQQSLREMKVLQATARTNLATTNALQTLSERRNRQAEAEAKTSFRALAALHVTLGKNATATQNIQQHSAVAMSATQDVLTNVLRLLEPFSVAAIEYKVVYSLADSRFARWRDRILVQRFLPDIVTLDQQRQWITPQALILGLSDDNELLPSSEESELEARKLINCTELTLLFHVKDVSSVDLRFQLNGTCDSLLDTDMAPFVRTTPTPTQGPTSTGDVIVDFENGTVTKQVLVLEPLPGADSGRIRSPRDLWSGTVSAILKVKSAYADHPSGYLASLRIYPDRSLASFYDIPLQRSTKHDTPWTVILQIKLTEADLRLHQ